MTDVLTAPRVNGQHIREMLNNNNEDVELEVNELRGIVCEGWEEEHRRKFAFVASRC